MGVEKRNDLLDLENTFVAIPNQLLLNEENTVSTFKEKFTDAFLKDLIQIALLKETNYGNAKVKGNFGNINYLQNFLQKVYQQFIRIRLLAAIKQSKHKTLMHVLM